MIKTFAAALAPIVVLGRGNNTGISQEDAAEIELIPAGSLTGTSLKLYTYNMNNAGTDELHGDLSYTCKTSNCALENYIEMGFCFRPSAATGATPSTKWDCQRVRTVVNTKSTDEAYPTKFDLLDMSWVGATVPTTLPTLISDSDSATIDDQSKNWKSIPAKSMKTGCAIVSSTNNNVWCKELNSHFVRDWVTQATTDQDLQLKADQKDLNFDVFGYITSDPKPDYGGSNFGTRMGKMLKTKFVFSEYLKLKQEQIDKDAAAKAAAAAAAAAAAKSKGAISLTTYAAALAATAYALSF